jgi:hypothetical protein
VIHILNLYKLVLQLKIFLTIDGIYLPGTVQDPAAILSIAFSIRKFDEDYLCYVGVVCPGTETCSCSNRC